MKLQMYFIGLMFSRGEIMQSPMPLGILQCTQKKAKNTMRRQAVSATRPLRLHEHSRWNSELNDGEHE